MNRLNILLLTVILADRTSKRSTILSLQRPFRSLSEGGPKDLLMDSIRSQFPIFANSSESPTLAYLDSASTTQKTDMVLRKMDEFYRTEYANVHRGMYPLAEMASLKYESARSAVASFIGSKLPSEVIFTKGTTESLNLIASSYLRPKLGPNDAVVVTIAEHHSNFVPWQQLCLQVGAELRVAPILKSGELDMQALAELVDSKVQLVAVTQISNVTGIENDVKSISEMAHKVGGVIVVDAAQSVAHLPIDVSDLDVDFLAFSGHKMYGPTGIGVLYGKQQLLETMQPYQYGGDMIRTVDIQQSTWNDLPNKFEAGTPNIVGVIGLAAAIEFVHGIGWDALQKQETEILRYLYEQLSRIDGLTMLVDVPVAKRHSLITFTLRDIHPHDVATFAGERGVAIRAGDHCAQPLHRSRGLSGSIRASLGIYSTKDDIDQLIAALQDARQHFGGTHG